jgi:hypothetical protein
MVRTLDRYNRERERESERGCEPTFVDGCAWYRRDATSHSSLFGCTVKHNINIHHRYISNRLHIADIPGAWPTLALSTLPINTSCTASGAIAAFFRAPAIHDNGRSVSTTGNRYVTRTDVHVVRLPLMAWPPNSGAVSDANLPPNLPVAVRA